MRILLVGALSWNPERVRSLVEQGHEVWGVWARSMPWDQGPYPALDGCVRPVAPDAMGATIAGERIDCVLALFQVYDPALWGPPGDGVGDGVWTLLRRLVDERSRGTFDAPIVFQFGFDVHHLDPDVVRALDGVVFCNEEQRRYWSAPPAEGGRGLDLFADLPVQGVLDGDRPKAEFMSDDLSEPLSLATGEIHTVCVGRPLGIDYLGLAREGIHLHLYGNAFDDVTALVTRALRASALSPAVRQVRRHLHLHPSLQPTGGTWDEVRATKARWVAEFSRYDAGWSYIGTPMRWGPLEDRAAIPNKISTYLLAGLPVISDRRPGFYRYDELQRLGVGIDLVDGDLAGLRAALEEEVRTRRRRAAALAVRHDYSYDASIPALLDLLGQARTAYLARPEAERRRPLPGTPTPAVELHGAGSTTGEAAEVGSRPAWGVRHLRRRARQVRTSIRPWVIARRLRGIGRPSADRVAP